jgi:catechol 2,3-dioxygenase-like lactoylglutathione lyase family enzyme
MAEFPPEGTELTRLLVVSDVDASKRWYTDVLGATVYREYGGTSVVLQLLGAWFVLVTGGGPTEDKPTVMFAEPPDPDVVSSQMIFGVADCRQAYETLKERGAEFLTPPVDHGWETRAFFRDPDGHLFEISQSQSGE